MDQLPSGEQCPDTSGASVYKGGIGGKLSEPLIPLALDLLNAYGREQEAINETERLSRRAYANTCELADLYAADAELEAIRVELATAGSALAREIKRLVAWEEIKETLRRVSETDSYKQWWAQEQAYRAAHPNWEAERQEQLEKEFGEVAAP